ncbi:MAG: 4-(cytidine 5'-diphospho)-2-C-methyl-D-erythritol kinase [Nitrospirae bacterium]|nr:MAG: 4-(cytidine 5'-diphospho)-2-C-methyl-D-erythritol kinase [Nitrospirota bacterium]
MGFSSHRFGASLHGSVVKIATPAKINWSLYVLDKRPDRYHNICSLMQCVELYDSLTLEHANDMELVSDIDIPTGENLVFKAAAALRRYAGTGKGARISLAKAIPSGAGLGGGSSDAAAALWGLNNLWKLGLDKDELKSIGAGLGADVPFFFDCPMALAEGKGEALTPLKPGKSYPLLLVKPEAAVPTAWAYNALEAAKLTNRTDKVNNIKLIYDLVVSGNISSLSENLHNDFEGVVFKEYPMIGELKKKLFYSGAVAALMSGSGSSVFGVFESREAAEKAAGCFDGYWHRVVATLC